MTIAFIAAASPRRAAGARPASVTIAVTSAAGVTSNAGFSRAKARGHLRGRARCSIGISAPVTVARSIVEVGATTTKGIRWWAASTARP